ncbi:hypothetical protein RM572_00625 [Streptomyces sp. DSM 42041]|uniref:Uncharacterized protein n=1 Tax=Streptomyces hazeniae TaxID=3075538 RepID=A0ABU2NJV9_9ACTN|nr:hypothetical protein [Streptomyces sp. DSM 42041]MDT0377280.1 hypothetical protein [Streptomyces sp. DSM 42041]
MPTPAHLAISLDGGFFGNVGTAGQALVLTALFVFATTAGGKLKPLGWVPCLILGLLAGASFGAAGGIFAFPGDLIAQGIGVITGIDPDIGMGAIALLLLVIIGWKKLTTKQVAVTAFIFFYVSARAGGVWTQFADAIGSIGLG